MKTNALAIAAGLLSALFLALALWPRAETLMPMVVAARDLGAGTVLQASDLEVQMVPAPLPFADALPEPAPLLDQTLAVVRFAGEAVSMQHLGPAVPLATDERGIAVRVRTDSGLAGLLQPGQRVGLVAVVSDWQGQNELGFAKALIENVRVLWISPRFRLRPESFLPAADGQDPPPALAREGIIVLAVSTHPAPILYETQSTLHVRAIRRALDAEGEVVDAEGEAWPVDETLLQEETPRVVWGVPLEMIAALNHLDSSFTLVMQPPGAEAYTTPGFSLERLLMPLRVPSAAEQ